MITTPYKMSDWLNKISHVFPEPTLKTCCFVSWDVLAVKAEIWWVMLWVYQTDAEIIYSKIQNDGGGLTPPVVPVRKNINC